jgi:hypothetical protein
VLSGFPQARNPFKSGMASRPKPPEVPLDLWRHALDAALAFRALAPWESMSDSDVAAVVDPSGMPWFASVLGAAGQVYGRVLYRGEGGLRTLKLAMDADGPEDWEELRFAQDGLTVWFGPKSELSKEERNRYTALGYQRARGARLAWPSILDHRPGFVPWPPEADDVAWLAEALRAVMRFAELMRAYPTLGDDRRLFEYPLIPMNDPLPDPANLEWRLWDVVRKAPAMRTVRIDNTEIETQLRGLPVKAGMRWDIDWLFLPKGVVDGGRPYYPRSFQIFETRSGRCLAMDVINATDDIVEKAVNKLVGLMFQIGGIPQLVQMQKPELLAVLQPWLASLGASVDLVSQLKSAEEFRLGMLQFMGRA